MSYERLRTKAAASISFVPETKTERCGLDLPDGRPFIVGPADEATLKLMTHRYNKFDKAVAALALTLSELEGLRPMPGLRSLLAELTLVED